MVSLPRWIRKYGGQNKQKRTRAQWRVHCVRPSDTRHVLQLSADNKNTFTNDASGQFTPGLVSIWPAADHTTAFFHESSHTFELACPLARQGVHVNTTTRAQCRVLAETGEIAISDEVALLFCLQS